jgi:AbrB family looped-hinge helix DNA binding protein
MTTKKSWVVKAQTRGRITIPKQACKDLDLNPGDELYLKIGKVRGFYYIYLGKTNAEILDQI